MKLKKAINYVTMISLACLLISACSNPEAEGRKAAEQYCDCTRIYEKNSQKEYENLINKFESFKFKSRIEVRKKTLEIGEKVSAMRTNCEQKALLNYQKVSQKYISNQKKSSEFQYAYKALVESSLQAMEKSDNTLLLSQLENKIRTIIPPDPEAETIKTDLIERTIMEPTREKYRTKFDIKSKEQIKEVIINDKKKTGDEIVYFVRLNLSGDVNAYIADINITYMLGNYDDWTIEHIESKLLDIVPTGKFKDCIKTGLVESGWGGIKTIQFTNNCDVALLVEGKAFYRENWHPFSALVEAHDSREANSGFVDVKDFQITRIERP